MDKDKSSLLRTAILMAVGGLLGAVLVALGLDYLSLGKTLEESLRHWRGGGIAGSIGAFFGALIGGAIRRKRAAKSSQSPGVDHTA